MKYMLFRMFFCLSFAQQAACPSLQREYRQVQPDCCYTGAFGSLEHIFNDTLRSIDTVPSVLLDEVKSIMNEDESAEWRSFCRERLVKSIRLMHERLMDGDYWYGGDYYNMYLHVRRLIAYDLFEMLEFFEQEGDQLIAGFRRRTHGNLVFSQDNLQLIKMQIQVIKDEVLENF